MTESVALVTGLTKGNLSSHLSRLDRAGFVQIQKRFEGKQPVTYVKLTLDGREAVKDHWKRLESVCKGLKTLKPLKAT